MKHRFQVEETVAAVVCDDRFLPVAIDAVIEARRIIEDKVREDPFFKITYDPMPVDPKDDPLIQRMCAASLLAGVGPMAGVAGAVAEFAVRRMAEAGAEKAIFENGGDIAFYSNRKVPVGIYAEHPVLKDVAFLIESDRITGICSSSAKVGPSVSLGASSISTVFCDDVVLADCCATALGNLVKDEASLESAVTEIGSVEGVSGCFACCGGRVAMFGDVPEIVQADCSNAI